MTAKKRKKKTTAKSTGALVPQSHGGALRNGGTNKGGTGRPPSVVRAAARGKFDEHINTLDLIAKGRKQRPADRIRAISVLGRYGLDQALSVTDVRACLRETEEIIRDTLPRDQAEQLITAIGPTWLRL